MVNGKVMDQYDLCSKSSTNGWAKHTVNLSAYVGQTVDLQIRTETGSSANSNLFLDDISFQPTAAAAVAIMRVGRVARRFTGARVPAHPAIREVVFP
jgi:bacillopeptidase F (M6 metalloprotease family)